MKFSMPADRPAQPECAVQWVKSSLSFANGNLATMPMAITVTGSFDQIKAFLSATENLKRAWLIDNVSAQGGAEDGKITLTATGSMFVLDTTETELVFPLPK